MSKIYDALKRAERERELATDRNGGGGTDGHEQAPPPSADGQEADDYRRLRATLLFAPVYSDVRTIAVTATRHGEGATRVAVGLARAMAIEGDARVLLVEADRTPVVEAESAKHSLDRVGARIFGVVLNRRRSYVPAPLQALL